jgi:ankyrin repeat protein
MDAITRLQKVHEKGNKRLESLIRRRDQRRASPIAMARLPSISVPQNSQDAMQDTDPLPDDIDIMKDTLDTAWDILTAYEPNPESIAGRMDQEDWDSGIEEGESGSDEDETSALKVTETVVPFSPGHRSTSLSGSSIPSNVLHNHSRSQRVLDGLVRKYQSRFQSDYDNGHFHGAEENLLKAMEYAEERLEQLGIPFNKVQMREQLALVYKKQSKREEVFKVLEDLLPKAGDPDVSLTLENTRHYQMIGETYYELGISKDSEQDLRHALDHAYTAFNGREQHEGTEGIDTLIEESAKLLGNVYEALNMPVEAEVFRDMFPATHHTQEADSPPLSPTTSNHSENGGEITQPLSLQPPPATLPPGIDPNAELIPTIKASNLPQLRALLQREDIDVNQPDRRNKTPLMYAFKYSENSESMPLALLEKGSKINADDDDGRTVLHQAAAQGQASMIQFAISHDAHIESKDKDRLTPLLVAAKENHRDCKLAIETLLSNGADPKVKDKDGWTILHHAAHNSASPHAPTSNTALRLLKHLLENCMHIDIEAKDRQGYTTLCRIADSGDANTISTLLNHGADANAENKAGRSPLYLAMHQKPDLPKHTDVIKLLAEHGARVEEVREQLPAEYKKFKYLLEKGKERGQGRRWSESRASTREIERAGSVAGSVSTVLTEESGSSADANIIPLSKSKKKSGTLRTWLTR